METANDRTEEILQEELERATVSSTSSDQQQDDDTGPEEGQPPKISKDKPSTTDKESKKKNKYKAVFNITEARYPVVRYVGKKLMGYKLTKDENADWDLFWVDNAVLPETLAKMKPYQKINHFPGMYSLARKNHLGRNLMRMKKAFPKNFKFFPQTFLLPAEYSEFRQQIISKKGQTYIVKPEASCQGKGIFLTKTWENIEPGEHYVIQRYLTKPFLLDGLKFDLRIYVLLAGCDPLRIYLYDDGLGRFATEEYVAPTANNMDNMCIHLTNYAINKDNPNFVFNEDSAKDDVGHKRSLKAVLRQLEDAGHDVKTLWNDIKKIIIKTFCSVQPIIAHSYKSCQPDEPYNNMCFEVLGFDIILDHKLKPWLLEVNHTPSFTTDTPLDKTIKRNVIKDALTLMNISSNHRIKYKNKKKVEMQERVLTGKKTKPTLEEKQAAHAKAQKERDAWESKHLGGYEKIYPIDDPAQIEEDYEGFIAAAHAWWETWTGTTGKKNVKKPEAAKPNAGPPTAAGSTTGPSLKMKEVRSASEKLKLDALSRKISSSKKMERNEGLFEAERKQDESLTDALIDQETQSKTEITPSNKSNDGEQQVPTDLDDLNFVTRSKAEKTDTKEDRRDSSVEKHHKGELMAPEGPISVIDFAQHRISQSENTLRPEENSQREVLHDQYKSPIPFRKPYVSLTTKESASKQMGSPIDQENSKTSLRERPQTFTNQQKFPPIYLKPHATTIAKLPDNVDEEGSLSRRNQAQSQIHRISYQKATTTRLPDEVTNTEEQVGPGFERKTRNFTYIENGKVTVMNKNGYLKGSNKRMELQPHQAKMMPVGNFVVPRMFELSVKSTNAIQPVRQTTVHSGFNAFSKGLVKGSQLHREVNNRSSASGYPPEGQVNSSKGYPFYVQARK